MQHWYVMTYRRLQAWMWALGMPTSNEQAKRFAVIYRTSIKAGMSEKQASMLIRSAYDAAQGYTWKLAEDARFLERATKERNATTHPNGKDAEELAAERDGRASRWGTQEFHRA